MQTIVHIGEEILKELKAQERSVAWLAKKVNRDRSNLNKQLKCPHLHGELLYRISTVLGVDFLPATLTIFLKMCRVIITTIRVKYTAICGKNSHAKITFAIS